MIVVQKKNLKKRGIKHIHQTLTSNTNSSNLNSAFNLILGFLLVYTTISSLKQYMHRNPTREDHSAKTVLILEEFVYLFIRLNCWFIHGTFGFERDRDQSRLRLPLHPSSLLWFLRGKKKGLSSCCLSSAAVSYYMIKDQKVEIRVIWQHKWSYHGHTEKIHLVLCWFVPKKMVLIFFLNKCNINW